MKILLTTLNSKFIHTNLAIRYLKYFSKDLANIDVEEFTINNSIDYIIKEIYRKDPDVVAFSTYIWNVEDTLKICENIKKINPRIKILLGGPEVSYDSKEMMEKYNFIDFIIFGEGEITFRECVEHFFNKKELASIDGLVYREDNKIIKNKDRELILDLNIIPSPYSEINKAEYENRIVYYETSRGCPFNCEYCLSSTIKSLRYFDIDRVKTELRNLMLARVKQVKFVDRTFNANKSYALEVMQFIIDNDNDYTSFHFEVTAHLIDEDMLEFLSKVKKGLFQFEVGVQSTNEITLNEVGRCQDFERLSYVVKKINSFGNIHMHLDLIAGLPFEGYESFRNSFNMVFALGIDHLQLGFLKMLKGSGIRNKEVTHGYIYKNYPPYEVLGNKYLSFKELLKIKDIEEVLELYYNTDNFKLSVRYVINKYYKENPFLFFEELSHYYEEKGHFKSSQGRNSLYQILLDFYNETIGKEVELFKELLKYDYLYLSRTSTLPRFLEKIEVDDFKNRCHKFLQEEENIERYLPKFKGVAPKNIIKEVHFEMFSYEVLKLKEDIDTNAIRKTNTVIYIYKDKNDDFESTKTFEIQL